MSHGTGPIISPAAAAARSGLPVWAVHMLLKRRVLRPIVVRGHARVSAHELDLLLQANRPESAS